MKFIQVTDMHLVGREGQLYGLDPFIRLHACLTDIKANHADAEFCVFTGDLTHRGEVVAYEALRELLASLPMPSYLLLGNHDKREEFLEVFTDIPRDENGFVQTVVSNAAGEFILLDTQEPGVSSGRYCERRLEWLRAKLEETRDRPVYLFMHHPPFDIEIPCLDRIGLKKPGRFAALLKDYGNIRHLFFGHVHRPVCGSWRGIPFSALRGLNHQVPFDLHTVDSVPKSHEPPAYAVVFIGDEQTTVHFHDYLDKRVLVRRGDSYEFAHNEHSGA